jgi:monofunctional biosynthetic peptidoglycan transglycosylase
MAIRSLQGYKIDHKWVKIGDISPNLVRAVIASEDGRFCAHWGFDVREIIAAIRRAENGVPRGASTVSMQVAKNMYLWPSQSYIRKALEVPATAIIELIWSKTRILEVYLNIAEWGKGVFGAEAAARLHFKKASKQLTPSEAALLAVSLPNPLHRRAGRPTSQLRRLAARIEARVRSNPKIASCIPNAAR